jgi:hypothetical protein
MRGVKLFRFFSHDICDGFQHLSFMVSQKKRGKKKVFHYFKDYLMTKTDLSLQQ